MVKGFVFFHDACNKLRHLLIAAGCLQAELEPERAGTDTSDLAISRSILRKMDELTGGILVSMERFTDEMSRESAEIRTLQYLSMAQDSIHQMLDALIETSHTCMKVGHLVMDDLLLTERFHANMTRATVLRERLCLLSTSAGSTPRAYGGATWNLSRP